MPTYDYACTCGRKTEIIHRMSDSPDVKCPDCGKVMERQISLNTVGFSIKNGSETIAWKEKRMRMKKRENMEANQKDRWGKGPKVIPNIAGIEQESWSDCQKLAKECGLNHDSYTPMVEREKKEKAPKIYTGTI